MIVYPESATQALIEGNGSKMFHQPVQFRVLGPLEVIASGIPLPLGGPRHRRLLAILLVHVNDVVSAGRLIEAMWGENPPRSAAAMLHVRVSELRKALPKGDGELALVTTKHGYVLRVNENYIDAQRFTRLASSGRRALAGGDFDAAATDLRDGLALWRGQALVDVADMPFAAAEIGRLESLRLQAFEDRVEADLALGHHDEVIVELTAFVGQQPLRERFWRQLMIALYRSGRQSEALQTFQSVREMLVDKLGLEPGNELQLLQKAILRRDATLDLAEPATAALRHAPSRGLPLPITGFVGRESELRQVQALLQTRRLVTIVGVGGVGKSRLALEVAAKYEQDYRDGCRLVEFAAVKQPGLVAGTMAAALGVREDPQRPLIDVLTEHLRTARALLLLDNCEHLIAEIAQLAQRLLETCARLKILATSRERLGIVGETLHPLSGLTVPPSGVTGATEIARSDAVRLFAERAAAVAPGFRLSDSTAGAAAQICQRLDGLPLAIELAAARINAIDVTQMAARLDDRFRLLTQGSRATLPRHQTLRSVVDWSYQQLSSQLRRLFDRLCVFLGGFTLEAVEAICDDVPDDGLLADLLARLVDKSLVIAEATESGGTRYRMLETLRLYGMQRLAEAGPVGEARRRHATYFLALAEQAGVALHGPRQSSWLALLRAEHPNLRAALDWSIEQQDAPTAARLAGSIYLFWDLHGHYTEGRRWLTQALALAAPVPPAAKVRALLARGGLAAAQGDLVCAADSGKQAAELSEQDGNFEGLAHAVQFQGFVAIHAHDLGSASRLLMRALRIAQDANHPRLEGRALLFLAIAALARAEFDQAAQLAEACARVLREVGDVDSLAGTQVIRAAASWRNGDQAGAAAALLKAMRTYRDLGDLWGLSLGLAVTAYLAAARGDHRRLATFLAASEAVRESVGATLLPFVKPWHDTAIAAATSALGADAFQLAWNKGQALPPSHVVAEAIHELDSSLARTPGGEP